MYSWGNDINSTRANYNWDGAYNTGVDFKQTRDVGQYAANPWGFFDMHGNVWEWTADWYQAAYPSGNPVVDPTGPASGSIGSTGWFLDTGGTTLRSAKRERQPPSTRTTSSASVLVSNSSRKGAMYGRMTDMAERKAERDGPGPKGR